MCVKNPVRKPKDLATIHVMGKLFELMIDLPLLNKYNDPANSIVTIHIDDHPITITLIYLGAAINVMTKDIFISLGLHGLIPTPTVLELADRSSVKLEGMIKYVVITIASWNYPVDFLILQSKSNLGGHPLILGRPWLAIADIYIGFISISMVISYGKATKKLNLYP